MFVVAESFAKRPAWTSVEGREKGDVERRAEWNYSSDIVCLQLLPKFLFDSGMPVCIWKREIPSPNFLGPSGCVDEEKVAVSQFHISFSTKFFLHSVIVSVA